MSNNALELYKQFVERDDVVPEYDVLTIYDAYTADNFHLGIIVGKNKTEAKQAARYRFGGAVKRLHPTGESIVDWRTK